MATTSPDRILSLDLIRGIAVMGIFSVNVVGMAMFEGAYFYPPEFGFESAGDRVMWALNSIFVDGRFRSLFSILFGASMVLVIERAVAAGKEGWKVHFPRMAVLALFGALHYYLLWWGDILVNYALVGMVAYLFWRMDLRWLLAVAAFALAMFYTPQVIETRGMLAKIEASREPGASPELIAEVEEMLAEPPTLAEDIARDKADHASIAAHVRATVSGPQLWRPWNSVFGYGLETLGLMLIGMAGYRSGFLTGAWRRRSYRRMAGLFLGADLIVHTIAAWLTLRADFDPTVFYPWTRTYVAPLHAVGAIGYAALFMALFPGGGALAARFAAVGRAAFSNYLGATLVGTLLFYGTFGGLYGEVSRGEAWLFVPPVWALMLVWSKWWLDRFRYGPFEWAWRTLARLEWQPMRKRVTPLTEPEGGGAG